MPFSHILVELNDILAPFDAFKVIVVSDGVELCVVEVLAISFVTVEKDACRGFMYG